jgi:DNA-binding response OmpR family regulator
MARILIVEDDAHMLRVLAMWLKKNGHQIVEAQDGREAAAVMGDSSGNDSGNAEVGGPIDLIVSDINMPNMSGIELARWVREERGLTTPIILLSSRCDQSQIASNLVPYGITVHAKPFSPSRLVAQIEAALGAAPVAGVFPPASAAAQRLGMTEGGP